MLVLSRRLNEKILLPNINAAVQVLGIKQGVVRLGIEAPPEIRVLREELQDRVTEWKPEHQEAMPAKDETRAVLDFVQQLRERLEGTGIGLGLVDLYLDARAIKDAKATLGNVREALTVLRCDVAEALMSVRNPAKPSTSRDIGKTLLVEDDPNQRELLAGFLRLSGLDVVTAGDGCDALDYLHSHPCPEMMLLDMGLPRCDGATAVRHIRSEAAYQGLKIFAVTGSSPQELGVETGPTGINRWFRKPLDPKVLLEELRRELVPQACNTNDQWA